MLKYFSESVVGVQLLSVLIHELGTSVQERGFLILNIRLNSWVFMYSICFSLW